VFCRTIERVHTVAPPATRWLHLGTGTCVPLMKTVSLCGVPFSAGDAAGATNRNDMRELLESVGLLQLYGLFEDEEMTDSDILVQMISQPEQLREALKEVGVSRIGQREKIVAALKQKGAETGGTSGQNAIRVTVRYTHVHATDLVIACVLFPLRKGRWRLRHVQGTTQATFFPWCTGCSRTTRCARVSSCCTARSKILNWSRSAFPTRSSRTFTGHTHTR
jgi:hypothetical protein